MNFNSNIMNLSIKNIKEFLQHSNNRIYIITSILSLLTLFVYYLVKYFSLRSQFASVTDINLVGLIIFLFSTLAILLINFILKVKRIVVINYFVLVIFTFIGYNHILPRVWSDSVGNIKAAETFNKIGGVNFLKNYHTFGFDYLKQNPAYINKFYELADVTYPDFKSYAEQSSIEEFGLVKPTRVAKHPPTWFCIMGVWQHFFGGSTLSFQFLAIFITFLYIISVYHLTGLYFNKEMKIKRINITTVFVLLPAILVQSAVPKTDMMLGFVVVWLMYFLKKNNYLKISYYDIIVGIVLSIAILVKFTALILGLPVLIYYIVFYKKKFVVKLIVTGFSVIILPMILYWIFDYNILLNILMGKAEQDVKVLDRVSSVPQYIIDMVIYGQFRIGIPFTMMIIYSFNKKIKTNHQDYLVSVLFCVFIFALFFILWGSNIPRHIIGFLPLSIPLLIIIYKNMNRGKTLFFILEIMLIVNTILSIANQYIIINLSGAATHVFF